MKDDILSKSIDFIKNKSEAITITIGNQKGGVGKTTGATLISYVLARKGIKTLVVDLDPQSNATKSLMLTKSENGGHVGTIDKTIMRGVQDKNLTDLPVEIMNNLYLLPSFIDFQDFPKYVYRHSNNDDETDFVLKPLFQPFREQYDIIIIDVPPMSAEITNNAVVMSDYVLISLQTQERALTGAENYIKTLQYLKDKYNLSVDIIGILEVLQRNGGSVDKIIMKTAAEEFGEDNIFKNVIPQMERIKRFDLYGIQDHDHYDKRVLAKYTKVTDEFLERLYEFEN